MHAVGRWLAVLIGILIGVGVAATARAESYALAPMFGGHAFDKPVLMLPAPPDKAAEAWYVVEQEGVIWRIAPDEDGLHQTVFVDLRQRIESGLNEAGLLGMALHPNFAENGRVFLSFTTKGAPLVSHVAMFFSADGGRTIDAATETAVLTLDQPFSNHNGGHIAFGPDRKLYIGFGDGGSGGDPRGNGQSPNTLLGKLLRLDVDGAAPYAIPPDNPFAQSGARPEIYATGLRNPWRFSFDRTSGALWLADVGQNAWEEIDVVVAGGNYGWNIREGAHCFNAEDCKTEGLIDPVAEYGHDAGCSVTGGFVYRGRALPALKGAYLYADYCSGTIWGLFPQAGVDVFSTGSNPKARSFEAPRVLIEGGPNVSSFGEGLDGELYVLDHQGGAIYRLVAR